MTQNEFSQQASSLAPFLKSYAMNFTKDPEDANDLVQDTMVKAIRYYQQFEFGSNLKGWLFTIMKNTFINDYRKRVKTNSLIVQEDELSSAHLANSATHNHAEGSFVMKDIKMAIDSIPEVYSKPFVLFFEGYKYHEIAEDLSIPIGTVKTRIHVARGLLKNYLLTYAKYDYKKGQA